MCYTYQYERINGMKRILFISSMLGLGMYLPAMGQSNQSPALQQSTSTTDTRQANPAQPRMKKLSQQERLKKEAGMDTTLPKKRKPPRLRPDSLRRGGVTKVDTV